MSRTILKSIRIPKDIKDYIDNLCILDDREFTYVVNKMLREFIKLNPNKINFNSKSKDS